MANRINRTTAYQDIKRGYEFSKSFNVEHQYGDLISSRSKKSHRLIVLTVSNRLNEKSRLNKSHRLIVLTVSNRLNEE